MELTRYLEAVATESDAMAGVVDTHPTLAVPTCPGWQVAALGRHLGNTQRWVTKIVSADDIARVPYPDETPSDHFVGRWLREGAADLVAALQAAGPDKPAWTMGQPRSARFWYRRMAQEATVHRWDAEEAVGIPPSPIDSDLAADGAAEFLEVFVPRTHQRGGATGSGESFHIHRTDGPGEWLLRFEPSGVTVSLEHAKADVALRGRAEDLLLVLWGRRPATSVEVFGDPDRLARWSELVPAI